VSKAKNDSDGEGHLNEVLKKILGMLTEIRSILALSNEDKLSQAKKRLLPENSVKLQVYNLCDGTKSTPDIAAATQKPEPNVRAVLSTLRNEGLIRSFERDGKQVHEQIF
jgi:DNA-binding transcriptional ArsR family regulator